MSKKERVIDTFAARDIDIELHDDKNLPDSIGEYSMRNGSGLELRKRRYKRKKKIIV